MAKLREFEASLGNIMRLTQKKEKEKEKDKKKRKEKKDGNNGNRTAMSSSHNQDAQLWP